jgi:hypothetical protein
MTYDYGPIARTAARMIGRFGKNIIVNGRSLLGINREIRSDEIDNSRVLRGDRSIIFVDPVAIGELINDEGNWYIYDVIKKQPADTALVYIAFMRQ